MICGGLRWLVRSLRRQRYGGRFRLAWTGHRDILNLMSTAELKQIIDERTPEERQWMTSYLLDRMFAVPELRQTAEELSGLAARRAEMAGGTARIAEAQAEVHWRKIDDARE